MRRSGAPLFILLAILLAAILPCRIAAAEAPAKPRHAAKPPIAVALIAGLATALIPLGLGSMHTAGATTDAGRDAGYMVAGAGFALAPIVSHIVVGEWQRAAAFGAVPVASEIALVTQLATRPDSAFHGTSLSRTTFGALFTFDVFGAAIGLYDTMLAEERAARALQTRDPRDVRSSLSNVRLTPTFGQTHFGLTLSGTL